LSRKDFDTQGWLERIGDGFGGLFLSALAFVGSIAAASPVLMILVLPFGFACFYALFGCVAVQPNDARISHLAYAPEIAAAILQRQQAHAVVAAQTKIVEVTLGMVQMALERLVKDKIVDLDDERRAAMVSNLLVVLCGHAQPVINTGSLY